MEEQQRRTDDSQPLSDLLCVGDRIEFDFFGTKKTGEIEQVGKYGYWIMDNLVAHGHIRCPFENAKRVP